MKKIFLVDQEAVCGDCMRHVKTVDKTVIVDSSGRSCSLCEKTSPRVKMISSKKH